MTASGTTSTSHVDADGMLAEPWSSGERVLVGVAASLWDTGRVDLGYVAVVSRLSNRASRPARTCRAKVPLPT